MAGVPTPSAMRVQLEEMIRTDPSVEVLSYMIPAYLMPEWAHSFGVLSYGALRATVPPVPPRSLRERVASPEEAVFLWSGARDVLIFTALYRDFGRQPDRKLRVFDFGCGCGRMTRIFGMDDNIETFGCDINRDLVEWCQKELRQVTTVLNGASPPLAFESGFFDFAYSLSIFTHLPENAATMWLDELARVCAQDALIVVTTHGYPALETIRSSPSHQEMFDVDAETTNDLIRRLPDEGFIFLPYDEHMVAAAKAGESYGNAFIDPGYAAKNWNTVDFEIVKHIPGGLRAWQDIFVLRRR